MAEKLTGFVFGGTGTIGSSIVKALAQEPRFNKVLLIGRRDIQLPESDTNNDYSKFQQHILTDMDAFISSMENASLFNGISIGFYALGISSTKVDEDTYRKIEHDYCIGISNLAHSSGCKHFHYISGRGANDDGWFLFAKVKAQVEQELTNLKFPRLSIYRPAAVLGKGDSTVSKALNCTFKFFDRCHTMSIEDEMVGKAVVANTFIDAKESVEILENPDIVKIQKNIALKSN